VKKVISNYTGLSIFDIDDYIDTDYSRPGQDVRYALDDNKLRSLGWKPKKQFDLEIKQIVQYYKSKFIW
jgi:dTDP-D-glucose 4,6-dehydratase